MTDHHLFLVFLSSSVISGSVWSAVSLDQNCLCARVSVRWADDQLLSD
jgi:hypothetical protein